MFLRFFFHFFEFLVFELSVFLVTTGTDSET